MSRITAAALLLSTAALADPVGKGHTAEKAPALATSVARKPTNRVLTLTDELLRSTVPELFVAPGTPTTVLFPQNVDRKKLLLADPGGAFYPPIVQGNTTVLLAKSDLPPSATVPLSVPLEDGTVVSFVLRPATATVDLTVTVELQLTKGSAPESVESLKQVNAQLRAKLDEYQANSKLYAVRSVAGLVIDRDLSTPGGAALARTFEGHRVHSLDKQQRLLVEAHYLYRLFNYSYLLLTVENRDDSRVWVFDRAEVHLIGSESTSLPVAFADSDLKTLPPGEVTKIVVVFETQAQAPGQRMNIEIFEKGGPRNVSLGFEP